MMSLISAKTMRKRAFTLIELLVVIGIIGLLIAILLPSVKKAVGAARNAKVRSELNLISMALDLYKGDYGSYPRLSEAQLSCETTPANKPVRKYGSELLVRCLIAPFNKNPSSVMPQVTVNGITYNDLQNTDQDDENYDGADGPGFRVRRSFDPPNTRPGPNDTCNGQVKGPYIAADKFRWRWDKTDFATSEPVIGTLSAIPPRLELIDSSDNAILYYPGNPAKPDVRTSTSTSPSLPNYAWNTGNAQFDSRYGDYKLFPLGNASIQSNMAGRLKVFLAMLGDSNINGVVNAGEQVLMGEYILYSPGNDGVYGIPITTTDTPATIMPRAAKCDDIIYAKN